MSDNRTQSEPQVGSGEIAGRCVEVGDDDEGQPRLIIHTTREQLMRFGRNLTYADVVVTARLSHATLEQMVRGSTPELSDASTGWWWLWCDEQWCAAYVRNEKSKWTKEERLDVTWLRPAGGMSRERLRLKEVQAEKWGGRIAAPNEKAQAGGA